MTASLHWHHRVGYQRDWVWRGWQTRYTFLPAAQRGGDAPPLMLLHGFGASIGHWRHNIEVLGDRHPVYALDLLGFGGSEKAITAYNVSLWVEQLYDFWRTFIGKPMVLVGNSIGSLVCLGAAIAHPEMVEGLVMLSLPDPSIREEMIPTALLPAITAVENAVKFLLLRPLFYWVRRPSVVRPWARIAYASAEAVTDELVEILAHPARDKGAAQAFCRIINAMTQANFGPRVKAVLPMLQIPMLLIWGKQDRMIPPGLSQEFVKHSDRLELVELENAGHCPQDECPDEVNALILDWVERHRPDPESASPAGSLTLSVSA